MNRIIQFRWFRTFAEHDSEPIKTKISIHFNNSKFGWFYHVDSLGLLNIGSPRPSWPLGNQWLVGKARGWISAEMLQIIFQGTITCGPTSTSEEKSCSCEKLQRRTSVKLANNHFGWQMGKQLSFELHFSFSWRRMNRNVWIGPLRNLCISASGV